MEDKLQHVQEAPALKEKILQKLNRFAPYILSFFAFIFIFWPYSWAFLSTGRISSIFDFNIELFLVTIFLFIVFLGTILWVWKVQSFVKYWILTIIFIVGFVAECIILYQLTFYFDIFAMKYTQDKFCNENWVKEWRYSNNPDFPRIAKVYCETAHVYKFKAYPISPTTQISPSPTAFPIISFKSLPKSISKGELTVYSDPNTKTSFSYPQKYFSKTIPTDENGKDGGVYILGKRDVEKEKVIDMVIQCALDDRKGPPGGLCLEGIAGDVQVEISLVSKIPALGEDQQSVYSSCEKQELDSIRTIYSCSRLLAPSPAYRGMEYTLYFNAVKPFVISISTYDPLVYADVITNIIDSAEILP